MTPRGPQIVETPGADDIEHAAERIRSGNLVAFPTETVYGLGADATNDAAVARIFETKQRPSFNPLICHFSDTNSVAAEVAMPPMAELLADAFWPGSLTLVVPRLAGCRISRLASAGLDTLAVRVPDHPLAAALIAAAGCPIAAPSANRSGDLSPTRASHVAASLGDSDVVILDGGPCRVGLESTVVAVDDDGRLTLLRNGGIASDRIAQVAGCEPDTPGEGVARPSAPGMLTRHYGTTIPLRIDADQADDAEIWICFGPVPPDRRGPALTLSETRDLREAAANLFEILHQAERSGARAIAVAPIPEEGLGVAINDRLRRSAAASQQG